MLLEVDVHGADAVDLTAVVGPAAAAGLPGKPAPDTFLAAAEKLAVEHGEAVVVEDEGRYLGLGMDLAYDEAGDVRFEPRSALQAGDDGMEALARITACAYEYLRPGGWLVLEHGYDQGEPTTRLLQGAGYGEVSDHNDAAGLSRVSLGRHPAHPARGHRPRSARFRGSAGANTNRRWGPER